MTASQGVLVPRKTGAVTVAGVLLLLLAIVFTIMVAVSAIDMAFPGRFSDENEEPLDLLPIVVALTGAPVFGSAGFVIVLRWRGWRIWAGTISWGLIAMAVLDLFALPPPSRTDQIELVVNLIVVAFAVFVLVATRRERRPNISAVFDP